MNKITKSLFSLSILAVLFLGSGCTFVHRVNIDTPSLPNVSDTHDVKYSANNTIEPRKGYYFTFNYFGHTHNIDSDLDPEQLLTRVVKSVVAESGYDLSESAETDDYMTMTVNRFNIHNVGAMWSFSLQTNIMAFFEYSIGGNQGQFEITGYGKNVCQIMNSANLELSIHRALDDFEVNLKQKLVEAEL